MENLPIDIIKQIQCFNTHPIASLFETEFKDFIDDHVWEEYNDKYESVDTLHHSLIISFMG